MQQFHLSLDPPSSDPMHDEAELIVQGLNPSQQEAVRAADGPVLIIAGPGSGKTRTLTHRIAYLIATGKARPYDILAVTFTNKAAREMKTRIQKLIGDDQAKGLWMGTFHAIFARLLRRDGDKIGYSSDFTIYDTDDSERILRQLMKRFNIDSKQFSVRAIRSLISSAKNQMVSPGDYARLVASPMQEKAAEVYGPYQELLRKSNALDFDDLLLKPIDLFQRHPDVLERYQSRWRYLHIDEYQDTNQAQYTLCKMLAARHKNLCVVGDDAQSIYAFRGADIGNILSFQRDYPQATVIRLEQNYRSTKSILRLADAIIKENKDQLEKSLWTDNREGEPVHLLEAISEKDEAQKVERIIRDLHARMGYVYRDFAILYRTNAQSRSLEDALRKAGIPYRIIGGVSFYQRREIKDVLAYLRLIVNPNDTASLRRVINYPVRGIGNKTVEVLVGHARTHGLSLWQTLESLEDVDLSSRAKKAVEGFRFMVAKYAAQAQAQPAEELAKGLITEAGIFRMFDGEISNENLDRKRNVEQMINAIAEFRAGAGEEGTLSRFLQEVSLMTDADEGKDDDNRVTLMTLHASKGLEFPVVFVTGLEEGLFPLSAAAQDRKELEEERRLFYVGVTRAESHLYLTTARSRFRYGEHQPSVRSRFLDELGEGILAMEGGGSFTPRGGRYTASGASSATNRSSRYDNMDPHYYRKTTKTSVASRRRSGGSHGNGGTERRVVYDEEQGGIAPGARVEHPQFGEGKVLSMEGQGAQAKAVVFFKGVGQKKLVLRFARLRRID